ncbi:MAG: hypothetical protein A3C71_00410 [Candidatus Yanofskybacteria bacterium RIFCSPHIGHO2_02_FULL_43_15c]|uniref:Uncharacterized protein n=1 Tax=Candidatus Yanofskybacteria bacterium RIFCSPHIGHO2_02_FULL_43_15c TaxID=1802679 RepID=A0A1F8FJ25_9BACT|nr:MAG: hypothetical protein A3C71_00410 [Candidatus Yanofskybacteria bacterium RIFCSPHIGHO2_02_FULL_43_15c]
MADKNSFVSNIYEMYYRLLIDLFKTKLRILAEYNNILILFQTVFFVKPLLERFGDFKPSAKPIPRISLNFHPATFSLPLSGVSRIMRKKRRAGRKEYNIRVEPLAGRGRTTRKSSICLARLLSTEILLRIIFSSLR